MVSGIGWNKRIKIPIDHNDIDAALSDFPHRVYLSASSGHSNKDVSCVFDELGSDANRKKIAITKADGITECYVEIEHWDHANEKAWLWVKVPDVDPDMDTELWLYYDHTHADNDAYVGDPSDAVVHNVWDVNHKLVSHMRDDPDTSHIRDSTVNANDGTKKGANEPIVTTAGIIDGAQDFDGDDYIGTGSVIPDADFTLSAFVKLAADSGVNSVLFSQHTDYRITLYGCSTYGTAAGKMRLWIGAQVLVSTMVIRDGVERHITLVRSGDDYTLYINGVPDATGNTGVAISAGTFFMGIRGGLNFGMKGIEDEVRVSHTARTPAWVKANYESERDHLNDFGVEETRPSRSSLELSTSLTSDEVVVTRPHA